MSLTKAAALFIIITLTFVLLIYGKSLLVPFVIAVLVWYIISALSHRIGKFGVSKKYLPEWAKTVISTLIIAGVLVFVGGLIVDNVQEMNRALPRYSKNVGHLIERIGNEFTIVKRFTGGEDSPKLMDRLGDLLSKINFSDIISNLINTLSGVAGNTFLIVIYVIFLLLEQAFFPKKIRALFSVESQHQQFQVILEHINDAIRAYFKVKLTVSLVTAFASYILMVLVGLDFAVFWAFLIFLLNFIPNIGSLIATIFPSMLALIQFDDSFLPFIIVLVGVGAIQLFVGNLIEPRMMGSSLNISSLVVILALTLWGALWGITGMILCVPITVMMMIIFAQFPSTRPLAVLLSEKGELLDELEEINMANE